MSEFDEKADEKVVSYEKADEEVVSTKSLIDNFFKFKNAEQELKNDTDIKIFNLTKYLINKLTNKEIEFALNIIEQIKTLNLKKQKGQNGGANEIITFQEKEGKVIVKSIKRNNCLYYIFNILLLLITYGIISTLFQNTFILNIDLINKQFDSIQTETKEQVMEITKMNEYIQQFSRLNEDDNLHIDEFSRLSNNDNLPIIQTIEEVKPFIIQENYEIYDNYDTNMFSLLSKLYQQVKSYTNFNIDDHFPDIGLLIKSYEISKKELASLTSMNSGFINNMMKIVTNVDKTQQKIMLLQQMVNLFPTLLASYSLKITRVTSGGYNIYSLLSGLVYRLGIMFAIYRFNMNHGDKIIKLLTDNTTNLTISDYNLKLEKEEKESFVKIFQIIEKQLGKSNILKDEKDYIKNEILQDYRSLMHIRDLEKHIIQLIDNLVGNLDSNEEINSITSNDVLRITNGHANGGKPRSKTRRKIRRNKKAKTKKRKVNKKTKKRKTNKKTKVNRKKSKRKTNKRRTKK